MGRRKPNKISKQKCQAPLLILTNSLEDNLKMSEFDRLPNEMIDFILGMLTLPDKKVARLVCNRWSQVLERKLKYNYPLSDTSLSKLNTRKYSINELKVILNELTIPKDFSDQTRCSLLTVNALNFMASKAWVDLHHCFDGVGVKSFLTLCESIRTLQFDFTHLEVCRLTSSLEINDFRLPFLKKLQLKLAYGGRIETIVMPILRLETPCLEILEVERFNLCPRGFWSDENIYLGIQQLIVRNKSTLKSLKLVNSLINRMTVPRHHIPYPRELLHQLSELKLETLEIDYMQGGNQTPAQTAQQYTGFDDWAAANQLLRNHTGLKTFKLTTNSTALIEKSYPILAGSRNTLTTLEVDTSKSSMEYDLEFLRFLIRLKHLSFSSTHYEYGQFPESLQTLVWNAPLCDTWYRSSSRDNLFNLVTMTVGVLALQYINVGILCKVLFTPPMGMKLLTICRSPCIAGNCCQTVVNIAKNNGCLGQALRLDTATYDVEYDDKFIYVTLKARIN